MESTPFLRPIGLTCAIIGIVQSVIYIGLTLYGGLTYTHVFNPEPEGSFEQALFTRYFYHAKKDASSDPKLFAASDAYDPSKWNFAEPKVLKPSVIDIILWIYLAVNLIWLGISAFLLFMFQEKRTDQLNSIVFGWVAVIIEMSIMDLVLTILFGLDHHDISVAPNKGTPPISTDVIAYIKMAAIVMMCISARGFLLWIVNIVLAIALLILTLNVKPAKKELINMDDDDSISQINNGYTEPFTHGGSLSYDKKSVQDPHSPGSPHWHPPINAFSYSNRNSNQPPPWEPKQNVRSVPLKNSQDAPHPGWTLRRDAGVKQWDIRQPSNQDQWDSQSNHDPWQQRPQNNQTHMSTFKPVDNIYSKPIEKKNKKEIVPIPLPDYSPVLPRVNLQPNKSSLRPALKPASQFGSTQRF